MEYKKRLLLYFRHISFILFLIAIIILYSGFEKFNFGKLCLIISFIYIIITLIMFFTKNKYEESNVFNNLVLCLLHFYICFVAYKYYLIMDYPIINNTGYFSFNFLMISICMIILSANKFVISINK